MISIITRSRGLPRLHLIAALAAGPSLADAQTRAHEVAGILETTGALTFIYTPFDQTVSVHWLRPDGSAVLLSDDPRSVYDGRGSTSAADPTPADASSSTASYEFTPNPTASDHTHGSGVLKVGTAAASPSFIYGGDQYYLGWYVRTGTQFWPAGAPNPQANFSNRAFVQAGSPGIAGLYLERPRWALVRVVGPTLKKFGITDACEQPVMEIHSNGGIRTIKGWRQAATGPSQLEVTAEIAGAFPLPRGSVDCALLVQLGRGAHTIVARPADGAAAGTVLIEAYFLPFSPEAIAER